MKKLARFLQWGSKSPALLLLLAILIGTAVVSPESIYPINMLQMLKFASVYGIIAIGQTLVVLTGGVDLSTGPLVILSLLMTSGLTNGQDRALFWVVPLLLGIGAAFGLFNGALVVKGKTEPMIATLVTAFVVEGSYLLYTGGAPKGRIPPILRFAGTGRVFGVMPVAIILWLVMSLIAFIILRRTRFGRSIYYVGSNRHAAYLSGINVGVISIIVYIISGLMSTIAGFILGGFIGVGTLQLDTMDYSFTPLIITLLGGTDFVGAKGGMGGTIGAVFVVGFLLNLVTLLRVAQWGKYVVQGLIILIAIVFLQWQRRENL